jgi:cytochrome c
MDTEGATMTRRPHFCVKDLWFLLVVAFGICGAAGAADNGKALFEKNCGACHVVAKSEPPRQGPHLEGVVGRHAGKIENFPYSNGLKAATFDWTPEKLDQWIADPQSLIQDSYMMYKQADPAIRIAIIGYLATLKAQ